MPVVELLGRDQAQWVIQPLIDAGLEVGQIQDLVFRVAFEDIVGELRGFLPGLRDLVADRPLPVQAAWARTISRMLMLTPPM
ncbi:hypothetical protein [Modestobacter lapidis]